MACCLPAAADSQALSFLQESVQLLSQPRLLGSHHHHAGRPKPTSSAAAAAPRSGGLPIAALPSSFAPLDALSLISLHCSSLEEFEPSAPCATPPAGTPAARPEDCAGRLVQRAPGRKPPGAPVPSEGGGGARVSRKQPKPRRSCESRDPAFQGVTLQMQLRLGHSSAAAGCSLLIRHRYSSGKLRKRCRIPLANEEDRPGTSEEEDGCLSTHRNKRCASCKTRKTPLWRDAEDGTPLCNACGIRYKKYRIRCFQCWNIPKHGGKPYSHCSNCGGRLHVVATQQKSGKRCATF